MSDTAQNRAIRNYRSRLAERGMARFEVIGRSADRTGARPGRAFSRSDPRESRRLAGGLTIQPAPEPSRPFARRRTSSTRASNSDGVSHSSKATSTPSSTS